MKSPLNRSKIQSLLKGRKTTPALSLSPLIIRPESLNSSPSVSLSVPDQCTAIIGWRRWRVDHRGYLLAEYKEETWPTLEAKTAICAVLGALHFSASGQLLEAPVKGCACEIYAYKTEAGLQAEMGANILNRAWGEVSLWGRVIEHQDGYRAQFAYPKTLTTGDVRVAARLARLYQVPVTVDTTVPVTSSQSCISTNIHLSAAADGLKVKSDVFPMY